MDFRILKQKILDDQFDAIRQVLEEEVGEIKERLSSPYPPPSYPGEPPHMRTGELRDSLGYSVSKMETGVDGNITATASYASYLQDGTSKMEARPFLPDESKGEEIIQKIIEIINRG